MPTSDASRAARTIARDCLAVRARVLGRAISAVYDDELRPLGVTTVQLNLLVAMERLGEPAPGDLVSALHLEKSTLSRNVERLVARGWIERLPGGNGHAHRLALTPAGRGAMQEASSGWKGAQRRVRRILGAGNLDVVDRISGSLRPSTFCWRASKGTYHSSPSGTITNSSIWVSSAREPSSSPASSVSAGCFHFDSANSLTVNSRFCS